MSKESFKVSRLSGPTRVRNKEGFDRRQEEEEEEEEDKLKYTGKQWQKCRPIDGKCAIGRSRWKQENSCLVELASLFTQIRATAEEEEEEEEEEEKENGGEELFVEWMADE
jgi:hypothetical protein